MERITTSTFVIRYRYSIEEFKERLGILDEEQVIDASVSYDAKTATVTLAPHENEAGDGPAGSWSD